jgi:hypothetical protein
MLLLGKTIGRKEEAKSLYVSVSQ